MLVIGGGGQHDDGGGLERVSERGEHAVPIQLRHVQVEQHHGRTGGRGDADRLPAVAGLTDDVDIRFLAEQVAQPVADDAVVVGDHDADRHDTGTRTVSVAPCPGVLAMTTVPPSSVTRSPDVDQPGAGVWRGGIEAGAGVAHGELNVPIPSSRGHCQPAGVAVPDGVGECLLGDAQQGVLDRCGDGDVAKIRVDGDAEPVAVGRADLPQGGYEPDAVGVGRAQLEQQHLHVAQPVLSNAFDRLRLRVIRAGPAHPGGDHA